MGRECCSLVVLCLGAVASLSAMALVSIGKLMAHSILNGHGTLTFFQSYSCSGISKLFKFQF